MEAPGDGLLFMPSFNGNSDMGGSRANLTSERTNKYPKLEPESEERKSKLRLAHREKAADPSKVKIL